MDNNSGISKGIDLMKTKEHQNRVNQTFKILENEIMFSLKSAKAKLNTESKDFKAVEMQINSLLLHLKLDFLKGAKKLDVNDFLINEKL